MHGSARFTGPSSLVVGEREITFENCIIAAGSQAATLPSPARMIRGSIDSTGALSPETVPGRLLVIGGGIIGLEMACVYDALGSKVTVVELLDQLIPGCDPDLVEPLRKRISARYEAIHLGTQVTSVEASEDGLRVEIAGVGTQMFDQILVAVGRTPNGQAIDAEAAGVTVDERGFIARRRPDAHQRRGDLRDRRHRRRPDARPQGVARGQGGRRGDRRAQRPSSTRGRSRRSPTPIPRSRGWA